MKVRHQEFIAFVLFKEFVLNQASGSVEVEGESKTGGLCLVLTAVQLEGAMGRRFELLCRQWVKL